jgi:PII-like signaling protein
MVQPTHPSVLFRIFTNENDHYHGRPFYEIFVEEAKHFGLAGATVLRGIMGFMAGSAIHTTKLFDLSDDLPIIIEIVDTEDKIAAFLAHLQPKLEAMQFGGLLTQEEVKVLYCKSTRKQS